MSYNTKVYRKAGGAELVVASGGKITIEAGGALEGTGGFGGNVAVAGGVLAIPVTHAHVSKTTGGVEALTLANGTPGQILTITLVVDGGDGTLTPATKTGFATIVFADAKDSAALRYIDDTVGWVLLGTAGIPAPPVIS
jgi:hypothetical protein